MPARQPFTQLCRQFARLHGEAGRADLHLHTTHSDGEFTPAELVERARRRGLFAVAVTDHDTLAAVPEARAAARKPGPPLEVIAGVEITAEYRGRELHLLGYFVRPDDPDLARALEGLRAHRRDRFREMADRLRSAGVPLDESAVGRAATAAPGRRGLARLLVEAKAVGTIHEAFVRYLGDAGPVALPKRRLPVAEAIARVRAAGGVTSWAHPPDDCSLRELDELKSLGLHALEAEYPRPRSARTRELRELAAVAGLAVTGGSDCHGPAPASRGVGAGGVTRRELDRLRALAAPGVG